MERLRQRDLRALLAFVEELYAIRDSRAFATHLTAALPTVVPAEVTAYNEINRQRRRIEVVMHPADADFPGSMQIFTQHMGEHPLFAAYQQGQGSAVKISDFLTRSQFRHTGLYNEFFRRMGVGYQMAKGLPAPPHLVRSVVLFRNQKDFSERDRLVLNLLRSHLNQAYQNAEAVTRMQRELELIKQGVEQLERGMIILTREGRVQVMSSRARQWVAEYFGRPSRPADCLPETLRRWLSHQLILLAGTTEVLSPREPLVVEREGKRLVVRLLTDAEENLLLLEEQLTALQPASLEPLGLSRREAEVLAWAVQGRSNYAIGRLLGISGRTVQKHLEHIYAKLGVWNRTEAATRALAALTTSAFSSPPP
jgi:DNA-binding CsgD family transcriptional regulator